MKINEELMWHPQITNTAFMIYCKICVLLDGKDKGPIQVTELTPFASNLTNPIGQLQDLGFIAVKKRPGKTSIYKVLK